MEKKEFKKVKPMSLGELITNRQGCQDVLEDQLNFPQFFYEGDTVHSMYSDRLFQWDPEKYNALRRKHFGNIGQRWENNSTDREKTKAFLEEYLGEKIDGFRSVRGINVANGYPLWHFQTYRRGEDSPEQKAYTGQKGPLLLEDPSECQEIW